MLAPPANRKAGMSQLLQELLKREYSVRVLSTVGHWLDINSLDDVVQAGNFYPTRSPVWFLSARLGSYYRHASSRRR